MAYTYQADVWCDKCAEHIKAEIARTNPELVPADPEDESSFDSGDYPKYYNADSEESDGPQNCASGNCAGTYGTFLENPLTAEGYVYLKGMLDNRGETLPEHAKEWAEFYGFTFHANPWNNAHEWLENVISTHAAKVADTDGGNAHASYLVSLLHDLADNTDGDTIQDLFQSDMDKDGYFKAEGWYSDEMEYA